MTRLLPYGAQQIFDARTAGKRPAEMVLVSLVGPLRETNPVVIANPERTYDWRFSVGLEVLIVADTTIEKSKVTRVINAVLENRPEYLGVWFSDRQAGMHVAFGSWRPRSALTMGNYEKRPLMGIGARP